VSEPVSHEEYVKAQAVEYGTYVAIAPIDHDGVRAYNVGHAVPKSNVEKYGYLDDKLVAKTTTKAAEKVTSPAPDEKKA
jgi:hypothetical protein